MSIIIEKKILNGNKFFSKQVLSSVLFHGASNYLYRTRNSSFQLLKYNNPTC